MKITKQQLRKIISETVLLSETQVALGLPHNFNSYDLAKRIYSAVSANEDEQTLTDLRNIALNKIKLLRRDIGQGINATDVANKKQEDLFLQQAIDHIDTHRKDYDMSTIHHGSHESLSSLGVPSDGPFKGRALNRRVQQNRRKMQADYFRARSKED